MPYPSKLTEEAILDAATAFVEEQGLTALSLRTLGARLNARAPSLYKYFPDKESLVRALSTRFMYELSREVTGHHTLASFAGAYRAYARAHPHRYTTIFRDAPAAERPPLDIGIAAVQPFLTLVAHLDSGPPLPLGRALWSYLHGAVSLEMAFGRQPRPGLDSDVAFSMGLQLLECGLLGDRVQHGDQDDAL